MDSLALKLYSFALISFSCSLKKFFKKFLCLVLCYGAVDLYVVWSLFSVLSILPFAIITMLLVNLISFGGKFLQARRLLLDPAIHEEFTRFKVCGARRMR